mmetsp:Transcript_50397/g.90109  ORF Transcript_50397/g.90109 Transcript_50397/m.90109 type:complete len:88 (+) Transcript_50397:94-357(+)
MSSKQTRTKACSSPKMTTKTGLIEFLRCWASLNHHRIYMHAQTPWPPEALGCRSALCQEALGSSVACTCRIRARPYNLPVLHTAAHN